MQPNRLNTASPFVPPPPSASPGAVSVAPSDSDWSTASEWSLTASSPSSRAPSPYLLSARSTPQHPPAITEEHIKTFLEVYHAIGGRLTPTPSTSQCPPPAPVEASTSRPSTPESPKPKIPRPANAFMLYRSWLLKSGRIPPNVEKRQQHISKVAGECWNLLPNEEKKPWHDKAEVVKIEHSKKYPEWKFTPERKSARQRTSSDPNVPAPDSEEHIRWIREKYVGLRGAPVTPPRPRKSKSRRTANARARANANVNIEPVPALSDSPTPSPASTMMPLTPSSSVPASPVVPLSRPPSSLSEYRLPILASAEPLPHELDHHDMLGKFVASITAKALTFNDLVLPAPPKYTFPDAFPSPAQGSSSLPSDPAASVSSSSPSTPAKEPVSPPPTPVPVAEPLSHWAQFLSEDPNMYFSFADFNGQFDIESPIFPDLRSQ